MTLTLGSFAGMEAVDGTPSQTLVFLALFLCSVLSWRRTNRGPHLAVGCLALVVGASSVHAPPSSETAHTPQRSRDRPLIGRWHNLGAGRRGVLRAGTVGDTELPGGHDLLLDPWIGRIPEGSWVALLPGGEVLPWPRGPVLGPAQRSGPYIGSSRLQPDEVRILPPDSPGLPRVRPAVAGLPTERGLLARLRDTLRRRADALESSGPAHGLVRALLLGDRSLLSSGCLDLFTRTGARHALALSGLHVGLLAALLLLPATSCLMLLPLGRKRSTRRRLVLGTRLALIAGYVALVGAGASVLRAGIAVVLMLVAPALPRFGSARDGPPRRTDPLSIVSVGWLVELVRDPLTLRDTSMRLSYLATVGILLGTGPLAGILGNLLGKRDSLGSQRLERSLERSGVRRLLRVLHKKLFRYVRSALAASLCAVLATLPEIAERFGELSPPGILLTPIVLPCLAVLVVSSWIGALLEPPFINELVPRAADLLVEVLAWVDRVPHTPCPLPQRPVGLLWLAVGLIFLQLRGHGHGHASQGSGDVRVARILRGTRRPTLLLVGILLLPWAAAPAGFELHLIDVGHGTAAVVRAPGLPALVFDAGSQRRQRIHAEVLGPLLSAWEVSRPLVALSHPHRDHTSGLSRFIERYPPRVWLGALPPELAARLEDDVVHLDPGIGRTGITFGPSARAAGPLQMHLIRGSPREGNEGSRSLELTWRGERILLTGDAEAEGLQRMLDEDWLRGPSRLLLFPHHGSHTRALSALLARVAPREVWISGAAEEPPVAAELERRSVPWRGTAQHGPQSLLLP